MSDSLKFNPLTSSNYYAWHENMHSALILKDLWDAVEESHAYNELPLADRTRMDNKALALIRLKINTDLRSLVEGCATARNAWTVLHDTFRTQSMGRKSAMRQQ
jgi:gag-polypeptide of LTR copia-type/Domain of unknown function (DUF4219)